MLTFSSFVAASMSLLANMALITAIPQIPLPASSLTLSFVIPPIAMTGISTASHIAFNVSKGTSSASSFEPVGNTAPTPK